MSSRVFQAHTSHTEANPQLCGLTGTPIQKDDWCFYLVCRGTKARPQYQISVVREEEHKGRGGRNYTKKIRETPDGQPFFSVFTGQWETYTKADGSTGRRRVYEWQTEDPKTGARVPVTVWSNMVLASAAEKLGYAVPKTKTGKYITTKAHVGDRTRGFEHQTGEEEPAMVTIAKAALSDEEAGLVEPTEPEAPVEAPAEPSAEDEDEASLAEALGLTVEQFRKLQQE